MLILIFGLQKTQEYSEQVETHDSEFQSFRWPGFMVGGADFLGIRSVWFMFS